MCETGEDSLTNAKRELLEETGLQSDDWSLWFISDPWKAAKVEWNNYFYIAKNCKKVSEPKLDPGEKIQSTNVTFDEFLEIRNNPRGRNRDLFGENIFQINLRFWKQFNKGDCCEACSARYGFSGYAESGGVDS
jgi:8-oxo-dGTP pyrophosphatase MutT (NUDIX family)